MPRDKSLIERVKEFSSDVTPNLKEVLLFQLKLGINLLTVPHTPTSRGVWKVYYQTLAEMEKREERGEKLEFDTDQIVGALRTLQRQGLIKLVKDKAFLQPQITKEGQRKIEEGFPTYKEKRTWDKKFYMVTYDIPETRKSQRYLLREFLLKIGAGQLQKSVYITPYNPENILKKFLKETRLAAQVIISSFGRDGGIAGKTLSELLAAVYNLAEINKRYRDFLEDWSQRKTLSEVEKTKLAFQFNAILLEDPQLPFELLPKNWCGEKACKLYKDCLQK